jgi:membrane protein
METLDIKNQIVRQLLFSVRWVIIILLILYSIGFIYKYAPAITKSGNWPSPGAIFATFLVVLVDICFFVLRE